MTTRKMPPSIMEEPNIEDQFFYKCPRCNGAGSIDNPDWKNWYALQVRREQTGKALDLSDAPKGTLTIKCPYCFGLGYGPNQQVQRLLKYIEKRYGLTSVEALSALKEAF